MQVRALAITKRQRPRDPPRFPQVIFVSLCQRCRPACSDMLTVCTGRARPISSCQTARSCGPSRPAAVLPWCSATAVPDFWDYLGDLARLLERDHTVVRFDQRGCGRSTGRSGPFTISQAVSDLDDLRRALAVEQWAVLGHSWGAELALRYAAAHPGATTAVVYVAGVGAGDGFREAYVAERDHRLGAHRGRWESLVAHRRSPDEEREWCLLQWQADFSPAGNPEAYAEALWRTRPPGVEVNSRASRELWDDRRPNDLLSLARHVRTPVTIVLGADDPRPWTATDDLTAALPEVHRVIMNRAGHAPWAERPHDLQAVVLTALRAHHHEQTPVTTYL